MKNKLTDLNVLIVEDEESNYILLTMILNKIVNKTDLATNGQEAVELVKKNQYDIILMDVRMPVMEGHEATRQIRLLKPNIPIIAQSATPRHYDEFSSDFDDYITKPFTKADILRVLTNYGFL